MSDGRFSLGISKKWQLCSPTANPRGTGERKQKMSPHFEDLRGQKKKKTFNEALSFFSEQEKKNLQILLPDAFWKRLSRKTEMKTHT